MSRLRFPALVFLAACAPDANGTAEGWAAPPTSMPDDTPSSGFGWSDLSACPSAALAGPECQRSERALAEGDAAQLGVDASAFLQLISGEHRSELTWQASGGPGQSTALALVVEPQGDVRFVDNEMGSSGYSEGFTFGNTGGRYLYCGDRLAVDAQLTITSADGALNEVVDAVVEADSGRYARTRVSLRGDELTGSLAGAVQVLTLAFGISELGLDGSLAEPLERRGSDIESGQACNAVGSMYLGEGCTWGAVPVGADDEVLGLSFSGALDDLNATSPATLLDTGAELTLALDAPTDPVCVSIDTPAVFPSVLEFPGRVQLASSDGRVGGSLDVRVRAEALGGSLRSVAASAGALVPMSPELGDLARSYAILEPLTWREGEQAGFEFLAEAGEPGPRGFLRAIGGELHCEGSRPCDEVCPGPGCTSVDVEKWAVRWGSAIGPTIPVGR